MNYTTQHTEMNSANFIQSVRNFVQAQREQIITDLAHLVNLKGGSEDQAAVNAVGNYLADLMAPLDFQMHRFRSQAYGDHLLFENYPERRSIMLAGHMDTTFTDYSRLPSFQVQGEKGVGPGTADMRGGLLVAIYSLKCLHQHGLLDDLPVRLFCNSDEERGSPDSRVHFEELAARTCYALVFECGGPDGTVVIGRRGKISGVIHTTGQARHAAEKTKQKRSAVLSMAHQIIALEALNEQRPGLSCNVGQAHGGATRNTVPHQAQLAFDIRYVQPNERDWICERVSQIAAQQPVAGCQAQVHWHSERPVWPAGHPPASQPTLLHILQNNAQVLGQNLPTEFRYGTSDANFFAHQGVPTIDGLGPVGFLDHTANEYILLPTLFERIQLCSLALYQLAMELAKDRGQTYS